MIMTLFLLVGSMLLGGPIQAQLSTVQAVEVLIVEHRGSDNKVVVSKPSGEMETLYLEELKGEDRGFMGQSLRTLFQGLYVDGWEIESVVGPLGPFKVVVYVLQREVR